MINYAIMKGFNAKLLEIGALNSLIKKQAGEYFVEVSKFVSQLRNDSGAVSITVQSVIADSEARILTLETNQNGERIRNRKLLDKLTADIVGAMLMSIDKAFEEDRKVFSECEVLARQIVIGAKNKHQCSNEQELVEFVKHDEELAPYYFHIAGRIGTHNLYLVLGEQFNL